MAIIGFHGFLPPRELTNHQATSYLQGGVLGPPSLQGNPSSQRSTFQAGSTYRMLERAPMRLAADLTSSEAGKATTRPHDTTWAAEGKWDPKNFRERQLCGEIFWPFLAVCKFRELFLFRNCVVQCFGG